MTTPLTIWSNRALPEHLANDFEKQLAPHRVVWSADANPSVLKPAGSDNALVEQADVAFGQPTIEDLLAAKKLKLVCLTSAGYTRYDRDDLRANLKSRGIPFCNASGVFAEPVAQHAFAFILSAARRLPDALAAQATISARMLGQSFRRAGRDEVPTEQIQKDWNTLPIRAASVLLTPSTTVLLVGYGAIAKRLVEILAPLGVKCHAFRRSPRGDEVCPTSPISEIDKHLATADHIVNILPASDETNLFFDAKRFGRMKQGALFYNVGRGDTVDQKALVQALVSGQVGQAYLDVTTPEPLPPSDPLWLAPNCYITPHTAGGSVDEAERQIAHFVDNVKRFERGEPLNDRVF